MFEQPNDWTAEAEALIAKVENHDLEAWKAEVMDWTPHQHYLLIVEQLLEDTDMTQGVRDGLKLQRVQSDLSEISKPLWLRSYLLASLDDETLGLVSAALLTYI